MAHLYLFFSGSNNYTGSLKLFFPAGAQRMHLKGTYGLRTRSCVRNCHTMLSPYASFNEKYFYSDEYLDTLPKRQNFKIDKETGQG